MITWVASRPNGFLWVQRDMTGQRNYEVRWVPDIRAAYVLATMTQMLGSSSAYIPSWWEVV